MDLQQTKTQKISKIRDKFLDKNYVEYLHDDGPGSKHWVYIIKNKLNSKLYVGKCKNLTDRASYYIRQYLDDKGVYTKRPITEAISTEGIESFIMYPVCRYKTDWDACATEISLITQLNTTDPSIGYNLKDYNDYHPRNQNGYNHSIDAKIVKGKPMICIHPELKIAYVAVGMKIFGDFLGISKDLVKNCAKRPCMCRGFHIYYLNEIDREEMYQKRLRTRDYADVRKDNKEMYLSLYPYVKQFSEKPDPEIFTKLGYDMRFLTYNPDINSEESYDVQPIDAFMEFVNNDISK